MAYIDDVFNTSGKIPTDSDFWDQPSDRFVTGDGITPAFSKVIGEQVFRPINAPTTPFYNRIIGEPLNRGAGWTERAINKRTAKHFKPKATAQDDLGFYDSSGIEKNYKLNVAGWIPVSIPSDLETAEMMVENYSIGQLNSMLVDSVMADYQQCMESEIEKYVVSSIKNKMNIDFDSDIIEGFGKLMDIATDFMGDENHYNELTNAENSGIYTHSDKVVVYLPKTLMNKYRNAKAGMPSPNELVSNVTFVEMYNQLAKPITTAEWDAGRGEGEVIAWDNKPVAIDEARPDIIMTSADKFVYRPYRGTYRMGMKRNEAGDFDNFHLVWKGAIANHPWDNGLRIYNAQ